MTSPAEAIHSPAWKSLERLSVHVLWLRKRMWEYRQFNDTSPSQVRRESVVIRQCREIRSHLASVTPSHTSPSVRHIWLLHDPQRGATILRTSLFDFLIGGARMFCTLNNIILNTESSTFVDYDILKCIVACWEQVHVWVMEGYSVYEDRILSVWAVIA